MHNSSPGNGGEMASHHTLRQIGESPPTDVSPCYHPGGQYTEGWMVDRAI